MTGGWAYGRARIEGVATTGVITRNFSNDDTLSGWTIGGVEWAMWDRWSAKAEYLYIDLGDGPDGLATAATLNIAGSKLIENVARVGLNYRF